MKRSLMYFGVAWMLSYSFVVNAQNNPDGTNARKESVSKLYAITNAANSKTPSVTEAPGAAPSKSTKEEGDIQSADQTKNSPAKTSKPIKKLILREPEIPTILKVAYDGETAEEPVTIYAKRGFSTLLLFAPGEHIERCGGSKYDCIDVGDSSGWYVTGNAGDNNATIRAKSTAFDTNISIITNLYAYSLDLRVLPDDSKSKGTWRVRISHNDSPEFSPEKQARMLHDRLNNPLHYKRNRRYTLQKIEGSDDIIPSEAWDDGRLTYIRISNNREKPAFFKVMPDKSELTTNFHMEGDVVVLHEVARQWVMRYGSQVIAIYNEAFDPEGLPPVDGTLVPGVIRITKEQPL